MRVLVTGATGLVGSHAAARLAREGFGVRALVRDSGKLFRVMAALPGGEEVEGVVGDVADAASVETALVGCDALLHAAGFFSHRREDEARLRAANVEGARIALEAGARARLAKIVFVSSALALFPPAGPLQSADDPVTRPRTMYAVTKALAERHARALGERLHSLCIVYPSMVMGPEDPTVGGGPGMLATALRDGRVLVTEGGLSYTDARDLADLTAALFAAEQPARRIMAPARFLTHERYHALLCALTGRALAARRIPGPALRGLGRGGDLVERLLRRPVPLTGEAADALTRMVPVDDAPARALLDREPRALADTLRDTLRWMHRAGVLAAEHVGSLAERPTGSRTT